MSIDKKKLLLPAFILCLQLFLAACFPLGENPPDVGEIGEPQVSCSRATEVRISYPISPVWYSSQNAEITIDSGGLLKMDGNNAEWTSDTVSWTFSAPVVPTEGSFKLEMKWEVYFGSGKWEHGYKEREDTLTIPVCEFEAASPPKEEALDSSSKQKLYDGTPVIQSANCLVTITDRYMLSVDINFPQSSDGLNAEYEAFFDGEPLGSPRHLINDTLRFEREFHPGYSPLPETFILRSLPFHEVVMETTIEWQDCDAYPDINLPVIYTATCLKGSQLMVVFEFPEPVTSEYEAVVDGQVFQYTPVADYPNRAYFFGLPPRYQGPTSVLLSIIPYGTAVFWQPEYEFPACGVQREKKNDGGGSDHYVPPSY